jgi:hypothetical protein
MKPAEPRAAGMLPETLQTFRLLLRWPASTLSANVLGPGTFNLALVFPPG